MTNIDHDISGRGPIDLGQKTLDTAFIQNFESRYPGLTNFIEANFPHITLRQLLLNPRLDITVRSNLLDIVNRGAGVRLAAAGGTINITGDVVGRSKEGQDRTVYDLDTTLSNSPLGRELKRRHPGFQFPNQLTARQFLLNLTLDENDQNVLLDIIAGNP